MDFTALITNINNSNASFTLTAENAIESAKKIELHNLFVTQFPRLPEQDSMPAQIAFTYFDKVRVDLTKNQDSVQFISNELLLHTKPLNNFEQGVLNTSYVKSLKPVPSKANRL